MTIPQTRTLLDGLHLASDEREKKRIVIAVDGLDKNGKTHFAFSAPKPLLYLDFDIGKEGVISKARNPHLIVTAPPFAFRPTEIGWEIDNEEVRSKKIMDAADPQLTRFRSLYLRSLMEPIIEINGRKRKARTVVVDTGSETWQLLRLCYFGKLTKVMPHHYVEVNSLMRDLVRAAFDSDVNLIWLHKLKSEWKDNAEGKGRKTGTLERDGFEGMAYLVQANLLAYRVPANLSSPQIVKWKSGEGLYEVPVEPREEGDLGFRLVVGNSRHDPALEGLVLMNEGIDFPTIAQMMIPDSTPEDWADDL